MTPSLIATILFVMTLGNTLFFVGHVRRIAMRRGLYDRTGPRHLHPRVLPPLGGAGTLLGCYVGLPLSFALPAICFSTEVAGSVLMLIGGLIIIFMMLVDDLMEFAPVPRLLRQFDAAALVVMPRGNRPSDGIVTGGLSFARHEMAVAAPRGGDPVHAAPDCQDDERD